VYEAMRMILGDKNGKNRDPNPLKNNYYLQKMNFV